MSSLGKRNTCNSAPSHAYRRGDRVKLIRSGILGTVCYVGPVAALDQGIYLGIALDSRDGKHNGRIGGCDYFLCPNGHGVFLRPEDVSVVELSTSSSSRQDVSSVHAGPANVCGLAVIQSQFSSCWNCLGLSSSNHSFPKQMDIERIRERASLFGLSINLQIDDNGDCQFDAIADQLCRRCHLNVDKDEVRRRVVSWLRTNPNYILDDGTTLQNVFGLYETQYSSLEEMCRALENAFVWGNIWSLIAAAEEFGIRIIVISSTDAVDLDSYVLKFGSPEYPLIFLGHQLEMHYFSLLDDDNT